MSGRYAAKRLVVGIMSAFLISMLVLGGVPGTEYDGAVERADAVALTTAAAVAIGGAVAGGGTYAALEFLDDDQKEVSTDGSTAEEVQSSIYSSAGTIKQGSDTINSTQSVLNDKGQNYIFAAAKSKIVEAHADGEAESVAKEEARKYVNEEYASYEKAVLNRMTTLSNEFVNVVNTINRTSNLSTSIIAIGTHGDDQYFTPSINVSDVDVSNQSYTLQTGETHNWSSHGPGIEDCAAGAYPGSGANQIYQEDTNLEDGPCYFEITPVDSQLSNQMLVDGHIWGDLLADIDSTATATRSNVETFASDLYANYSPGEVNASEFLSPEDVASQYGLDSQNGSAYALANAAMLGYPTNATASVTIEYESTGNQVSGGLFAENEPPTTVPNGTAPAWVTGTTYVPSSSYSNASNYVNGSVYIADNSGSFNEIGGNFTIVSQTDAGSGENLSYAQTRQYTDLNTDATNLSKSLQNLEAALDERELGGGDGLFGGGLFGGGPLGIPMIAWLIGAVLVGAVVLGDD